MSELAAVIARIEAAFSGLSPQLRQAARYMLKRPDEVALSSMRRAAKQAGVHPSTMVRLARALSYPGYNDLREPFRQHLRGERRYEARARGLLTRRLLARGAATGTATLLAEIAALDSTNVEQSFSDVKPEDFASAVDILHSARTIYVVGLRKCYPVAHYFHFAYRMFRDNAVLAASPGGLLVDGLRGIGPHDALLSTSVSRYTRDTVLATERAAESGAKVIVITDSLVSPLAAFATHALVATIESPSFFGSLVGPMALSQALIAGLVARGGSEAIAALGKTERHLDAFGTYWEPAPDWERQA